MQCARQSQGVVARTIAGETLLVPTARGIADCDRIFILNSTGAFLWALLDGTRSEDVLAGQVEGEFDVDPSVARADVRAFLDELGKRQLLTWASSSA